MYTTMGRMSFTKETTLGRAARTKNSISMHSSFVAAAVDCRQPSISTGSEWQVSKSGSHPWASFSQVSHQLQSAFILLRLVLNHIASRPDILEIILYPKSLHLLSKVCGLLTCDGVTPAQNVEELVKGLRSDLCQRFNPKKDNRHRKHWMIYSSHAPVYATVLGRPCRKQRLKHWLQKDVILWCNIAIPLSQSDIQALHAEASHQRSPLVCKPC